MTTKHAQLGDRNSAMGGNCPLCKGTGKRRVSSFTDPSKTIDNTCYLCKGTGSIGKPTPPKRGKGGRWSYSEGAFRYEMPSGFEAVPTVGEVTELLNKYGVVLPARRERG